MDLFMKFKSDETPANERQKILRRIKRLNLEQDFIDFDHLDKIDDEKDNWLKIAAVILKGIKSNTLRNLSDRVKFYYEDQAAQSMATEVPSPSPLPTNNVPELSRQRTRSKLMKRINSSSNNKVGSKGTSVCTDIEGGGIIRNYDIPKTASRHSTSHCCTP